MSNQEIGTTEKLTEDVNVNHTATEQIPQSNSELKEKKSESILQLIKRSMFYSKKEAEKDSPQAQSDTVKKKKVASSLQNALSYELMYENGICDLGDGRYSITIGFDDINYQSASKDDQLKLFQKYCEVLEYYSTDTELQISVINRYISEEAFSKAMLIKPRGDKFDKLSKERNAILIQQSIHSDNNIISDKYITITIKSDCYKNAQRDLTRLLTDTQQNFKELGCSSNQLSGIARLTKVHEFFNPLIPFQFKYANLLHSNLTTKDYVVPESLSFESKKFSFNDMYGCVLYIKDFPTSISDQFIKELSDVNCQMSINLHLNSVDKSKALDLVDSQLSKMETRKMEYYRRANKYKDVVMIPRELQYSIDEAEDLRNAINNAGMKMFKSTIIITVVAKTEDKLREYTERLKGIGRQYGCDLAVATYLQKEGLNSSLLFGNNLLKDSISRTLTSASAGMFIPFTTQELFVPGGIYYGINRESNNILCFNRKLLKNPNGVVLATPGAGKSFLCKREAFDVFLSTNDHIIFLDPEREYSSLTSMLGGQNVFLSLAADSHINPFEINENYAGDDKDNPVAFKSDFITSMIQQIAGGKQGLSQMTLSIIDRCVNLIYEPYFRMNPSKAIMPTFETFWNKLKEQPEQEAKDLAVALERYVLGNLNMFSHQGNVNLNNRVVCLDIRDLGKQLRPLGMLIALDFIWNKITENREKGVRTWLYFDEFYLFFSDEHSANFFFELWKRARKWGAIPTGITQNVEDLLLSDTARRILSNTEFAVLLNNSASDRQELAHLFNLSKQQERYITNTSEGQGLIVAGKSIVPFEDKFPKDTSIYKVLTTKPDEVDINPI